MPRATHRRSVGQGEDTTSTACLKLLCAPQTKEIAQAFHMRCPSWRRLGELKQLACKNLKRVRSVEATHFVGDVLSRSLE